MKKYIVVVRDFNQNHNQPCDDYLRNYNSYYVSPIVELDIDDDYDATLDEFVLKYKKHFACFSYINLELISV